MVLLLLNVRAAYRLTCSTIQTVKRTVRLIRGMCLESAPFVRLGVLIVSKGIVLSATRTIIWSRKPTNASPPVLSPPLSLKTPKSHKLIFILLFTASPATLIVSVALDLKKISVLSVIQASSTTRDSTNAPQTAQTATLTTPTTPLSALSAWKTVSAAKKACFCTKATAMSFVLSALRLSMGPTSAKPKSLPVSGSSRSNSSLSFRT